MNSSPPSLADLERFQAILLDALATGESAEAVRVRLLESPDLAPFQAYVAAFDPRMIDVARELVKKWGRKTIASGKSLLDIAGTDVGMSRDEILDFIREGRRTVDGDR